MPVETYIAEREGRHHKTATRPCEHRRDAVSAQQWYVSPDDRDLTTPRGLEPERWFTPPIFYGLEVRP